MSNSVIYNLNGFLIIGLINLLFIVFICLDGINFLMCFILKFVFFFVLYFFFVIFLF